MFKALGVIDIVLGLVLLISAPRIAKNENSTLRRWFQTERTTMTLMVVAGGAFLVLGLLWLLS